MSKQVMVVDDDLNQVVALAREFEDHGYVTCTARDGVEALAVMKDTLPDLVVLNLEMPDEWGPRFYRKFNQDPELADTPVIVMSRLPGIHLAIRNALATVSKPLDHDQIITLVQETIGA
ncbi:Response regulator receiver domain-containing protein [Paucidesulfovibrio gracilis DSM 16080]|uniref:Response regulator receiver domain-containing protein n=1 Tax=Paucidesulfovibrio gracilis DSM 16080 TaxID=1121449 RepID=A0A1T4W4U7_9BACT|nr:response regulator [Paucidesulfovibrio gracilis]SKA72055.1 Response regulator receiver domain-containing protein [Paucidesulfovibrio gracilis DSM 16080]